MSGIGTIEGQILLVFLPFCQIDKGRWRFRQTAMNEFNRSFGRWFEWRSPAIGPPSFYRHP